MDIVSENDDMKADAEIIHEKYKSKLVSLDEMEYQIKAKLEVRLIELDEQMKSAKMLSFDAKVQFKSNEISDATFETVKSCTTEVIEHITHEQSEISNVKSRITDLEFEAYNALGFIPLVGMTANNAVLQPVDQGGSVISDVIVENSTINNGYVQETGTLSASPTGDELDINPDGTLSPITNYYTGQYIYTTNPNGVSRLFKITYYFYDTNTNKVKVRVGPCLLTGSANPGAAGVGDSASIRIFPEIEIKGDGTGAVAIPNIVDGQINNAIVIRQGSGYHNVTARVVDPIFDFNPEDATTTDIRASVRAVLSPDGGHGINLIDEFNCKNLSIYGYISAADNTVIGDVNTYSAVGVVRTPSFANTAPDIFDNRIAVVTNDYAKVTANNTITQLNTDNEIIFSARVHEVDDTANTIYLAEYMGPYQNYANTGNGDTSLDLTLPFRNETGQVISINTPIADNITVSNYIQRTGEVYFMEDFFPLARTDLSREEFKFVLEF